MTSNKERGDLIEGARQLDRLGAGDEAVARWLKERMQTFGECGRVLAAARGISSAEAYAALKGTHLWQDVVTRFRIIGPSGELGQLAEPNGRKFKAGDELNLPFSGHPPYRAVPGTGGAPWRVVAVRAGTSPELAGILTVEPLNGPEAT